jgi:uncharacterized membrane protein
MMMMIIIIIIIIVVVVVVLFLVMEHHWNEIDRGRPKCSEKNLSQRHFSHHKSHMD